MMTWTWKPLRLCGQARELPPIPRKGIARFRVSSAIRPQAGNRGVFPGLVRDKPDPAGIPLSVFRNRIRLLAFLTDRVAVKGAPSFTVMSRLARPPVKRFPGAYCLTEDRS